MGFFTLDLARMVGPAGRVVAVDIQPKMLQALQRRAVKAGVAERVEARLAQPDSLAVGDLAGKVDFVLAFAMVHELPSAGAFFKEAAAVLRAGGVLLLAEPAGHVTAPDFEKELVLAAEAGLAVAERPKIGRGHVALMKKGQ